MKQKLISTDIFQNHCVSNKISYSGPWCFSPTDCRLVRSEDYTPSI